MNEELATIPIDHYPHQKKAIEFMNNRMPINIANSINKNSILIMDGMLIIGWVNKTHATSIYGEVMFANTYKQAMYFITAEFKSKSKKHIADNKFKTRNLPNARA